MLPHTSLPLSVCGRSILLQLSKGFNYFRNYKKQKRAKERVEERMEMEGRGRQEGARKEGEEDKKKSCYYRTC